MQQEQQLDAAGIPLLSPVLLSAALSAASVTLWRKTKELSVLAKLQLVAGHSHRRPVTRTRRCSGDTMLLARIS